MARLIARNGIEVDVADDRVDALVASGGFTKPAAKKAPAKKAAAKKSAAKKSK